MSEPDMADLTTAVNDLEQGAADAKLWIEQVSTHAASVANQADSVTDATRRARLAARRLASAAARNNCVGVFGPSQAGKSYLVSALARPQGERLDIVFGSETRDFLREINPPGDRESTGLVTRFTIRQDGSDPAHPVMLRLLTETDLVKILANSFFLDFDPNNMTIEQPDEAAIRAAVKAAEAAAGPNTLPHLDDVVLFDLADYFQRNFGSRIGAFTRADYWQGLIRTAGRLGLRQRAELFALLWGKQEAFTELFFSLATALDQVGQAPDARAALGGLIPREIGSQPNSIIDVAVLGRLGSEADRNDTIEIVPIDKQGRAQATTNLPRATLTALIAEVSLVIAKQPWPFFEHTDLLDFPGARSRLKLTALPQDQSDRQAQTRELFLRGKIAYLFQRYTDELELTSMLLCMPPSVAEVKDLAGMVRNWIAATHGATPERRRQVKNALFLVLTKHDLEFLEKGGETAESRAGKWDRRLHASLLELYGKDGWPSDWDGKPFANTLFLRNPGLKQVHLMDYVDARTLEEKGPAQASADLIADYRAAFMNSPEVDKHFARKAEVWDAAMSPNDGGVAFLVQRLGEVLDPNLKRRQATERLLEAATALERPLRSFYHADGDAGRQQRDEALQRVRRELHAALREHDFKALAHFLHRLMLADADIRGVFHNVAALREDELDAPPAVGDTADAGKAPPVVDDPWGADPWAAAPATPAAASAPERRRVERPDVFATRILNLWAAHLRELQQNETALAKMHLPAPLVGQIVDELLVGAGRVGLDRQIADDVRRETLSIGARWVDAADRVIEIATFQINDFVAYLGYGDLAPEARPGFPEAPQERQRPVFSLASLRQPGRELGAQRERMDIAFFVDWGVALRQFGNDNVGHAAGRDISDAENQTLGQVLKRIDPTSLARLAS
ncbi:hypothetical protein SAMN07250955_101502 [Arboricoccus pini]|uniref:Virulence factor n=1 Tax=Arboricoccus pini TaxID=1963835 RepID=A0A212Q941_9PROT|nr:virulence factor SrfC family protein [Arboricoccus pini]SNB55817.1 hypothetical protein SAMN07250955_101502 [Arboricoccus pini]